MRSYALAKLVVPKPRLIKYGDRAFVKAAPCLWSGLPLSPRQILDVEEFKCALKIHSKWCMAELVDSNGYVIRPG